MVSGHGCFAPLSASTEAIWVASATKLRFFLATTWVFLRAEPTPLSPGRVTAPLNAVKPGGGLWVAIGHACLPPPFAASWPVCLGGYRHKVKAFLKERVSWPTEPTKKMRLVVMRKR